MVDKNSVEEQVASSMFIIYFCICLGSHLFLMEKGGIYDFTYTQWYTGKNYIEKASLNLSYMPGIYCRAPPPQRALGHSQSTVAVSSTELLQLAHRRRLS